VKPTGMFNYMLLVFFNNESRKQFKSCFEMCNKINNVINWLRDGCTAPQLMNLSHACHPTADYEQFTGKKETFTHSQGSDFGHSLDESELSESELDKSELDESELDKSELD